jgi:hypothetical protein
MDKFRLVACFWNVSAEFSRIISLLCRRDPLLEKSADVGFSFCASFGLVFYYNF